MHTHARAHSCIHRHTNKHRNTSLMFLHIHTHTNVQTYTLAHTRMYVHWFIYILLFFISLFFSLSLFFSFLHIQKYAHCRARFCSYEPSLPRGISVYLACYAYIINYMARNSEMSYTRTRLFNNNFSFFFLVIVSLMSRSCCPCTKHIHHINNNCERQWTVPAASGELI